MAHQGWFHSNFQGKDNFYKTTSSFCNDIIRMDEKLLFPKIYLAVQESGQCYHLELSAKRDLLFGPRESELRQEINRLNRL